MGGERPAQVEVAWHVFDVTQPHRRLQIDEQYPEYYRGGTYAPVRMPHVLHPHVRAGSEEQPVHRYEEEAQHVRGQRYAHEEDREG